MNEFARTMVYQRRKSMKAAVELALFEIESNQKKKQKKEESLTQKGTAKEAGRANGNVGKKSNTTTKSNNTTNNNIDQHQAAQQSMWSHKKIKQQEDQINSLENLLRKQNQVHETKIKALQSAHAAEIEIQKSEMSDQVTQMVKNHRKEVHDLKGEMRDLRGVQKTFMESYVEASLDVLRSSSGGGRGEYGEDDDSLPEL